MKQMERFDRRKETRKKKIDAYETAEGLGISTPLLVRKVFIPREHIC